MLVISRGIGDSFIIGDNIEITIQDISKNNVKISIEAPRNIKILRKELIEAANANLRASSLPSVSEIDKLKASFKSKK